MKARCLISLFMFCFSLTLPLSAKADTQAFATCLVDSLNGKERKALVKWIFFSIAVHPELKDFAQVSPEQREKSDRYIGDLVTRLFVDNCPQEAKAAQAKDPMAIQKAFELVGQVAMQETMGDQGVMQTISNYAKFADMTKINKLLAQ